MSSLPVENQDMLLAAINAKIEPIVRQLERMEERMESRTRDLVTRNDLEALRKELITKDAFEPQLNALKAQIARTDTDRLEDRKLLLKRVDELEAEQISKQDRIWMRLGQAAAFGALILSVFELMAHLKFLP